MKRPRTCSAVLVLALAFLAGCGAARREAQAGTLLRLGPADEALLPGWHAEYHRPLVVIAGSTYVLAEGCCEPGRYYVWSDEERIHASAGAERRYGFAGELRVHHAEDEDRTYGQRTEGRVWGIGDEARQRGQDDEARSGGGDGQQRVHGSGDEAQKVGAADEQRLIGAAGERRVHGVDAEERSVGWAAEELRCQRTRDAVGFRLLAARVTSFRIYDGRVLHEFTHGQLVPFAAIAP